jgi:hypothetical protein
MRGISNTTLVELLNTNKFDGRATIEPSMGFNHVEIRGYQTTKKTAHEIFKVIGKEGNFYQEYPGIRKYILTLDNFSSTFDLEHTQVTGDSKYIRFKTGNLEIYLYNIHVTY